MNCSTFVIAVFEYNRIFLCKKETWPIREGDREVHEYLIDILSKNQYVKDTDIIRLKNDIGCVRFRPEEVLCASSKNPLPCEFAETTDCSKTVLEYVTSN